MVRRQIRVTGLVQGVGFRWFAQQNAARLGLTGWVENQEDGSVIMEIQGEEHGVEHFTGAVAQGPRYARVESIETLHREPNPDERAFGVRDGWLF
ncbi:MAG TPA: acylphosphatase [Pseudoflavonifractor sp.]|nr:acylphosphatase [Pseudoflavonifractor sp.]